MEQQIKSEFNNNGFLLQDEQQILNKCLTMCVQYKLSPTDLVSSWDAFSLNRGLESTVHSGYIDAFLQQLQNEQKDVLEKKEPGLHLYSHDVSMILNDDYEDSKEGILTTPTSKIEKASHEQSDSGLKSNGSIFASAKPLDSVTPFGVRKNRFAVQFTLNKTATSEPMNVESRTQTSEDDIIKRPQPTSRCSLEINKSHLEPGCRFMYDRVEDKFNFLENRIMKHAKALAASGLNEEPMDPTVASQKTVFAVGMICCEEEGRLKEKPIMLQSSVEHSGGQRVRLDLQKVEQFSLFPGQVVGIEGHNPSGHCLIASKIIDHIPLTVSTDGNTRPTKKQATQELQSADLPPATPEISLIVAAGPYTTIDNLFFEPLTELLAYAKRKEPQMLILSGPFIDSEHPEIKKGSINLTYDEMFQREIIGRLQDYVECMGSTVLVILVPSVRDAHHDFVFPQPPFEVYPSEIRHQIHSITNPGTFSANQVNVACCTVDILKQLSAEEISRNATGESKHRLTTIANHLWNQRSFYPLYPPAEAVPVDFSLAAEVLEISSIPDILIIPSDLANFVRVLSVGKINDEEEIKCICVNPGRLARGEGGGFFVELNFKGHADSTTASVIRI
ncbi:DNA-directed DNA polymerase [Lithospermum erythrorhizon]|uniref:DNA polymerase alpha subunit B n=1 Tax=Lithospermum erythrorhizon TaxID=34254 RepID=A0AAV3PT77_LITER